MTILAVWLSAKIDLKYLTPTCMSALKWRATYYLSDVSNKSQVCCKSVTFILTVAKNIILFSQIEIIPISNVRPFASDTISFSPPRSVSETLAASSLANRNN